MADDAFHSREADAEDHRNRNRNGMPRPDLNSKVPVFEFINPEAVRQVKDANIICLEPWPFLEDALQYHDELLLKGRTSAVHKAVHDAIGVAGCDDFAELSGQCKLAFKDKFSWAVVKKYEHLVGSTIEYGERVFM